LPIDVVILVTSLSKLSETLSLSVLVLFFVLVWSTIHLFRFVNSKTAGLITADSWSNAPISFTVSQQLENWRRLHALTCQLVDRINSCFGFILLVAMTHGFISFISDSFEITMAFSNGTNFQSRFLIRFFQHFTLLFVVCYSSYRLQAEVYPFIQLKTSQLCSLFM
jgi:gustatory receptor